MTQSKFIVIFDTYCGWCYGAAPIIDALADIGAEVEALHRHLFQGPRAYVMAEGKGDHVAVIDARISGLTGQTFSDTYAQNIVRSPTEVLTSNYTAQAAALVHDKGSDVEFAVRKRLEKARFIDGVSAADRAAVVAALMAEGIPSKDAEKIGTPELEAKAAETTQRAEALMEAVGSRGVPTVLKVVNGKAEVVDHSAFYGHPKEFVAQVA